MAFNFPASPTVGQVFTPVAGVSYIWNGSAWAIQSPFAPLASPVFTGDPQAPTPVSGDNDTSIATTAYVKTNLTNYCALAGGGTLTGGFNMVPFNAGTFSSGTFTPNPTQGNYQYYTNGGAHTLAAPTSDCAIDVLITNGAAAGAITFTGFTVSANVGDALTTTSGSKFIISIRRINATATYAIKALQ